MYVSPSGDLWPQREYIFFLDLDTGEVFFERRNKMPLPQIPHCGGIRGESQQEKETLVKFECYICSWTLKKKQAPKSLIKRRVLKGDHPESENISNFGFSVTDGQQMHIIQICVLLTLICEISFLVIFWSNNFNNRLFDDIFCGDSTLCQLPKFKDGHKRNLVCLCIRKSGAVFFAHILWLTVEMTNFPVISRYSNYYKNQCSTLILTWIIFLTRL